MAASRHFLAIPLYKFPLPRVLWGRYGSNIFPYTPLHVLGESPPFVMSIDGRSLNWSFPYARLPKSPPTLAGGGTLNKWQCDTIFLKWGILNVPFCSIFVPFHFYLIMTLVVPCLDNILWFCWSLHEEILKLVQWPQNLFSWIVVPLGGEGVCACVGMVCYHCIVHIY